MVADDKVRELIHRTLQSLEMEVLRRSNLAQMNALLGQTDPALVLPSPCVTLLAVESRVSLSLAPGCAFRSLEPLPAPGDTLLTPVDADVFIHPWRVRAAIFKAWPDVTSPDRSLAPMLRVELERTEDSVIASGWLSLFVPGEEKLRWALARARVYCGGLRLRCRISSDTSYAGEAMASDLSATRRQMEALSANVLKVEIPQRLAGRSALVLDIYLPEGVREVGLSEMPGVVANVFPAWNSLDCRAPAFQEAGQTMGDMGPRIIHPLVPTALAKGWKAWSLVRVGSATDRMEFTDYHLAYLPGDDRSAPATVGNLGREPLVPCVVLSRAARERLDRARHRLEIDYRATQGEEFADLPRGTEFQMVNLAGLPAREQVMGRLVTASVGGSDGVLGDLDQATASSLSALRPWACRRSVGDAIEAFKRTVGRDLELVNERDFLRRAVDERVSSGEPAVTPLRVRVRVRQPGRSASERSALLSVCEGILSRYLMGQGCSDLRVIEQQEEMGGAVDDGH